jgi:hypothetical protein
MMNVIKNGLISRPPVSEHFREEAFSCLSLQDVELIMHRATVIAHALKSGAISDNEKPKKLLDGKIV